MHSDFICLVLSQMMALDFDETDLFQLLLTNLTVVGTMSNNSLYHSIYVAQYLYMCMSVCTCHPMHCNIKCNIT